MTNDKLNGKFRHLESLGIPTDEAVKEFRAYRISDFQLIPLKIEEVEGMILTIHQMKNHFNVNIKKFVQDGILNKSPQEALEYFRTMTDGVQVKRLIKFPFGSRKLIFQQSDQRLFSYQFCKTVLYYLKCCAQNVKLTIENDIDINIIRMVVLVPVFDFFNNNNFQQYYNWMRYSGEAVPSNDLEHQVDPAQIATATWKPLLERDHNDLVFPINIVVPLVLLKNLDRFLSLNEILREIRTQFVLPKKLTHDLNDKVMRCLENEHIELVLNDNSRIYCIRVSSFPELRREFGKSWEFNKSIIENKVYVKDKVRVAQTVTAMFQTGFEAMNMWEMANRIMGIQMYQPAAPSPQEPSTFYYSMPASSPDPNQPSGYLVPVENDGIVYGLIPEGPAPDGWESDPTWKTNFPLDGIIEYQSKRFRYSTEPPSSLAAKKSREETGK